MELNVDYLFSNKDIFDQIISSLSWRDEKDITNYRPKAKQLMNHNLTKPNQTKTKPNHEKSII